MFGVQCFAQQSSERRASRISALQHSGCGATEGGGSMKKMVLIVERYDGMRLILGIVARDNGHVFVEAGSHEAVATVLADVTKIDLAFVGERLSPGSPDESDTVELIRTLKERGVRVVAMATRQQALDAMLQAGPDVATLKSYDVLAAEIVKLGK